METKKLIIIAVLTWNFGLGTLFAQNAGDIVFNSAQIHTVKFYFSQANWYDSLTAYMPLDKKMLGAVEIDGTYINSVGVQFKGNSSYNNPSKKKSWKIDFNEFVNGQKYDGLKAIHLNNGFKDPTMMREKLMLDFCQRNGLPAPRCTYTNVYVNDTLWGFYTLVEQVNNTFLKRWFPENNGNLFKGDPSGTLQWLGSAPANYYNSYELKTNKTQNDWTDLLHLIDKINNTPSGNFYDSVESVLHTTPAIRAWAANILFANLDSYQGTGHNYYIYHDSINNKFGWITWDVNEAFGNFNLGMSISQLENLSIFYIPSPSANRPLEDKMLLNNTYKSSYIGEVCNFVANDFDTTILYPMIDSLANAIRSYVYADTNKFFPNQAFEDNINFNIGPFPGLKSFLANRRASVITELENNGCFMGTNEYQVSDSNLQLYPNPSTGKFNFVIAGGAKQSQIEIYNVLGECIYKSLILNPQSLIDISAQPKGIYFYRVTNEQPLIGNGKIVIQ